MPMFKKFSNQLMMFGLLIACAAAVSGCAYLKAQMAKTKHIREQTENHVYSKPLDQVWGQARQMLFEEGYEVKDSGPQDAETEWKESDTERTRYLLTGIVVSDTSCRVQFTLATQSRESKDKEFGDGTTTERDLDLENRLIKKVEPEEHARIDKEAQAKYDELKGKK
jgi:hypothetical protein